jgi:hypothetical protein
MPSGKVIRVPEKGIRGYKRSYFGSDDPVVARIDGIDVHLSELLSELSGQRVDVTCESESNWFGIHRRKL